MVTIRISKKLPNGDLLIGFTNNLIIAITLDLANNSYTQKSIEINKLPAIPAIIELGNDHLAIGGRDDGAICIFPHDLTSQKIGLIKHTSQVSALAFLDDGIFVSGSSNNKNPKASVQKVIIWEKFFDKSFEGRSSYHHTYMPIHTYKIFGDVKQLLKLPNNRFASVSSNNIIYIWEKNVEADGYKCDSRLRGHTDKINSVISIGNMIISGSNDGTIRVWKDCDLEPSGYFSSIS